MTPNTHKFQNANHSVDLSLPTDEELSREFGIPILTRLPEDFPGFSPDILIDHTNFDQRINAINEMLTTPSSFWIPSSQNKHLEMLAQTRGSYIATFGPKGMRGTLSECFMMKHSKLVSPELDLANTTRLNASSVVSPLTWEEIAFFSFHHEKRHIRQQLEETDAGEDFPSRFRAEWDADSQSLFEYTIRQQDPLEQKRVINATIGMRALSGFLSQPREYWIAPSLKETFNRPESREGVFKANTDPIEVMLSYTELRLRTISTLSGQTAFDNINSNQFREAILLAEDRRSYEIKNKSICHDIEHLENNFNSVAFEKHIKSGAALRVLSRITNTSNLSPFTRHCGQQVIDGAKMYGLRC